MSVPIITTQNIWVRSVLPVRQMEEHPLRLVINNISTDEEAVSLSSLTTAAEM